MYSEEYKDCLEYIDNYWDKIIYKPSKMQLRFDIKNIPYHFLIGNRKKKADKKNINEHFINIPHYYFVPNDNKFTYIFYWDSYFMFRGLMGTKRQWLMKEMVKNFVYLFNQYDIIPNFNAPASMGRSQPPFLSSMILDTYLTPLNSTNTYKTLKGLKRSWYIRTNKPWMKEVLKIAKEEYELVWIDKYREYNHGVDGYGLSRYGDRDVGYAHSSELESGWDLTSRYYNQCNHFLPVDLNSYLYKYEKDFAKAAQMVGDRRAEKYWDMKAKSRKEEINILMWDEKKGFFFDFNHYEKIISEFYSLAGFTPLWAGYAHEEQAKRMVEKLSKFETEYGLTITAKESLAAHFDFSHVQIPYHHAIKEVLSPKQWDYPNIWSPIEYQAVIGLLKYGYIKEAKRIMVNSVKAHAALYRKYNTFFEKINGETGEPSIGYHYSMQEGFGWTNAVFYRYIQILDALDGGEASIYAEPKPQIPPFELAILH